MFDPLKLTHDPGPCPVDDVPHTACTSPDYDGSQYDRRVVIVQPWRAATSVTVHPSSPGRPTPPVAEAEPAPELPPQEVATDEYRGTRRVKDRQVRR